MKIPDSCKITRYYVAFDLWRALSSWPTLDKAKDSIKRLKKAAQDDPKNYKADYDSVVGIVECSEYGRFLIFWKQ